MIVRKDHPFMDAKKNRQLALFARLHLIKGYDPALDTRVGSIWQLSKHDNSEVAMPRMQRMCDFFVNAFNELYNTNFSVKIFAIYSEEAMEEVPDNCIVMPYESPSLTTLIYALGNRMAEEREYASALNHQWAQTIFAMASPPMFMDSYEKGRFAQNNAILLPPLQKLNENLVYYEDLCQRAANEMATAITETIENGKLNQAGVKVLLEKNKALQAAYEKKATPTSTVSTTPSPGM